MQRISQEWRISCSDQRYLAGISTHSGRIGNVCKPGGYLEWDTNYLKGVQNLATKVMNSQRHTRRKILLPWRFLCRTQTYWRWCNWEVQKSKWSFRNKSLATFHFYTRWGRGRAKFKTATQPHKMRVGFLNNRMIPLWNRLPEHGVSSSVAWFKEALDACWAMIYQELEQCASRMNTKHQLDRIQHLKLCLSETAICAVLKHTDRYPQDTSLGTGVAGSQL